MRGKKAVQLRIKRKRSFVKHRAEIRAAVHRVVSHSVHAVHASRGHHVAVHHHSFGDGWAQLVLAHRVQRHHPQPSIVLRTVKRAEKNVAVQAHIFGDGWNLFFEQHRDVRLLKKSVVKKEKSAVPWFSGRKKQKEAANLHVTVGLYETGIDALLREIQKREHVTLEQVEATFSISKEQAEEWAKILEGKGLIELGYPAFGSLVLKKPKQGEQHEA
jgi:hypothetical protein